MTESTQGQKNRKNIQDTLEPKLSEFCPNSLDKMANLIAYKFHLSPYTVRYSYLPMFIDAGILELCNGNGCYALSDKVKQSQLSHGEAETQESATDYMKRRQEEKPQIQQEIEKERDFTLDLNDFIKSNHYEKLLDSELIEKINTLKNEKLKTNWIKQIKEGSKND